MRTLSQKPTVRQCDLSSPEIEQVTDGPLPLWSPPWSSPP